jgi:queuine tRNA-ribosyltransferase
MTAAFTVTARDPLSAARAGRLETPHGAVETPAFMPVASQGTVKALTHDQVEGLGADIILLNSYHLFLRPGVDDIEALGGLHRFIAWPKPILTDSGGFQIYSLSSLVRLSDEGVRFASHLDGTKFLLRPEDVVDLQLRMGSDVLMCLDHFPAYPYSTEALRESVRLTSLWARRSKARYAERETRQQLWGITQGGVDRDLRTRSIEDLVEADFPGYAYGGLGIGEPKTRLFETLELGHGLLPADRPRYLMGMGYVEDVVEAVARGVDLFDCVLPTRNARNGTLFTSRGRMAIKNRKYARDDRPLDESCACPTCRRHSRAYLRHLYERDEIAAAVLNTVHNLHFYLDIFQKMRHSITSNSFNALKKSLVSNASQKEEST